jgi:hypothetical protein
MSEDLQVDHEQQHPPDDPDADLETTAVRPALADDLLATPAYADDDELTEEELLSPGGQRPSRVTRLLLALLILAVGIFIGVQVARLAGTAGGATGAAASGQSRRFGPPGAGASGGGTAASRAASGSSAPAASGEISTIKAHTLVLVDQGARQSVTFTDATTVTAPYAHDRLVKGDAVSVFGSRAADGSVNATSIVVR